MNKKIHKMTKAVEEIYYNLRIDVLWLHGRWKVYRQLFGTNEERIKLLNESAGRVFVILQFVLLDDVILTICRLSDPHKTMNKENICLESLIKNLNKSKYKIFIQSLKNQLKCLKNESKPLRDHRNWRISHKDFRISLKKCKSKLPDISRQVIENNLSELREFMMIFEDKFLLSPTSYENIMLERSDGDTLIKTLKQAIEYRNCEKKGLIPRNLWANGKYKNA